jgi:integrase
VIRLEQWFETIKATRETLKPVKDWNALSKQTQSDYENKFKTMAGRLPAQSAQCKQSYYTQRAAFLHCQTRLIRSNMNLLDKWIKETGTAAITATPALLREKLDELDLEKKITDYNEALKAAPFTGARKGKLQASHAKRAVGKLPEDWDIRLLGGIPKKSKYRAHAFAMALCGCRPSEFEGGVIVTRVDENTFTFLIGGKKTGTRTKDGKTFTTGQNLRTITVKRDVDAQGQLLSEFTQLEAAMNGEKYIELEAKASAIRDVIIRASEKKFPTLKNRPSAYSFRHAFASDLKAVNGEDSEETARALGHASTKTQGCYGYSRSGRGRFGCTTTATASDAVRSPKTNRAQRISKRVSASVVASNSIQFALQATPKAEITVATVAANVKANRASNPISFAPPGIPTSPKPRM